MLYVRIRGRKESSIAIGALARHLAESAFWVFGYFQRMSHIVNPSRFHRGRRSHVTTMCPVRYAI